MWNIKDLNKNKTEQCIKDEQERLDNCKKVLNVLKKEYEKQNYYFIHVVLSNLEDRISEIEMSIKHGEDFIKKCNEHLVSDFNN